MSTVILRTDISKLKKQLLLTYVNQTLNVVDKNDPVALHVSVMLERLRVLKPDLELLEVSYGDAFEETTKMDELDDSINNVLRAILSQSKAIHRISSVTYSDECAMVLPFVNRYVRASLPENLLITVNMCNRMMVELKGDVKLSTAVLTVGLKVYFDELERLLDQAVTISDSKLATMTSRGKSITNELRKRVSKQVSRLMKAIEAACEEHNELDYNPLIDSLNVLNTNYRTAQKAKATRAKNANEAKIETTVASSVKTVATAV